MATSLKNLSNMIEIPDYDNPTLAAKILKLRCTGLDLCSILSFFIGVMLKINSTSGLTDMDISDFHQKQ